jgi:hypothetical protein
VRRGGDAMAGGTDDIALRDLGEEAPTRASERCRACQAE